MFLCRRYTARRPTKVKCRSSPGPLRTPRLRGEDGPQRFFEILVTKPEPSRQQLRQYLADLATIKEEEFKVMDREAQRCREAISGPAATSVQKKTGK